MENENTYKTQILTKSVLIFFTITQKGVIVRILNYQGIALFFYVNNLL